MMRLQMVLDPQISRPPREKTIIGGSYCPLPDLASENFLNLYYRERRVVGPFQKRLAMAAYWDSADGYGQSANLYADWLIKNEYDLTPLSHPMNWLNTINETTFPSVRKRHMETQEFAKRGEKIPLPPIGLSLVIPEDMNIIPPCPCLVAFTMWETDRLPGGYVNLFKPFDLVLVPSEFCLQTLRKSGFKGNAGVCALPINEKWFENIPEKPYRRGFRFLFVNAPIIRKGIDVVIDAFQQEFTGTEDVRLHLHTRRWAADANPIEREIRKRIEQDERISHSHERLDLSELISMFDAHDCVVSASRGEGLGLIQAQSLARRIPIIAPATTGLADFVDSSVAWTFPVTKWEMPQDGFYARDTRGYWTKPEAGNVRKAMRQAYSRREDGVTKAIKGQKRVWSRYRASVAGKELESWLRKTWEKARTA